MHIFGIYVMLPQPFLAFYNWFLVVKLESKSLLVKESRGSLSAFCIWKLKLTLLYQVNATKKAGQKGCRLRS